MRVLICISALCLFSTSASFAQDTKKDAENPKTKMDLFSSKTGTITKFIDTKLPNLKTSFGAAETRIRKITNGTTAAYFYQIEKEGQVLQDYESYNSNYKKLSWFTGIVGIGLLTFGIWQYFKKTD